MKHFWNVIGLGTGTCKSRGKFAADDGVVDDGVKMNLSDPFAATALSRRGSAELCVSLLRNPSKAVIPDLVSVDLAAIGFGDL